MTIASKSTPATDGAPAPVRVTRMIQLDVLRGVAILLVLGAHAPVPASDAGWLHYPAKLWEDFGWTGVDLFFVLSGFLVGGLLMEEVRLRGSLDVGRFIIRRAFKIWPAYYCLVLGSLVIGAFQVGWPASFGLYLPNLLHVQNYFGVGPLGPTWSLAVEEHFYLLLPLLVYFLTAGGTRGRSIHAAPWIAGAVIVGCNVLRLLKIGRPYSDWSVYFPTHLRIDGLAMGVLLAYFYHFRPQQLRRLAARRWTLLIAGLLLLSPLIKLRLAQSRFVWTVGFTMIYVAYACILTAFIHTPLGPAGGLWGRFFSSMAARLLASIGFWSYSIYLWHISLVRHPMGQLIGSLHWRLPATAGWLLWMSLFVAACYLVGFVLGRLIELPGLMLRDRLFPRRAGALRAGLDG